MKWLGYLLEIVGIGAAVGGLFLVAIWLGLIALGVALVVIGMVAGGNQ